MIPWTCPDCGSFRIADLGSYGGWVCDDCGACEDDSEPLVLPPLGPVPNFADEHTGRVPVTLTPHPWYL